MNLLFEAVIDVIEFINLKTEGDINDNILLSLTDHIIFAVKRFKDGIIVANPF